MHRVGACDAKYRGLITEHLIAQSYTRMRYLEHGVPFDFLDSLAAAGS